MGYNEKKNLSIALIAVFTLVCLSITGASYAFFVATVTGTSTATNIKTADLKATYSDGAAITGTSIVPGWSATKTISIENTGTYSLVYTIKWVNVTNGGMTDLKYSLTSTSTGAQANVSKVAAPTKDGNLVTSVTIAPGAKHTYVLTMSFPDTGVDQSAQMGKTFSARLEASAANVSA